MGNRTPVSTFVRSILMGNCLNFCQTNRLMGNRTPVSTFVRPRD
jgi:hypothetical protein